MARTLVLVDGHALVYRAYHALPPMSNARTGEQTNAAYGFASMLFKVLQEIKPDAVAVAFDRAAPTFRHLEYEQYKATRQSQPEDLRPQFKRVRQIVDALGIPVYEIDGFEADDVLGTLARQAEARGIETTIVTGDTDALQLVSPLTRVLTSRRTFSDTIIYDETAVRERYGLSPAQLVDFKALKGDPSDNIPGVRGIGEKTAARLIGEFGSLDALYANLDRVPPKTRTLLEAGREAAFQGRHLSTIVRNVPLELDMNEAHFGGFDRGRVVDVLRELEFTSLLNRIPQPANSNGASEPSGQPDPASAGAADPGSPGNGPAGTARAGRPAASGTAQLALFGAPGDLLGETATGLPLRVVRTEDALIALVEALAGLGSSTREAEPFTLRTVTDDPIQPMRAGLVGLAFATAESAWYVPLGHSDPGPAGQIPLETALGLLRPLLEDPTHPKVGHNTKYDTVVLSRHGVTLGGVAGDAMLAAYLLEANLRHFGLKDLAFSKLGLELQAVQALTGTGRSAVPLGEVGVEPVARFAGDEVAVIAPLREQAEAGLRGDERLWSLYRDLELPLSAVLAGMEEAGVAIDVAALKLLSRELSERIAELERRAYAAVGHEFNLTSTLQLRQVLYDELKLPVGKRGKTGPSTDAAELERLRGTHEIIDIIQEHRDLIKLKSTYVDALPLLVHPATGRVHTTFNQTGTETGRLSSSDPNLQNIPVRTELGRQVRRTFIPGRPDHVIVAADYSQVELRILAHITHDPALIAAFTSGRDIHTATAMDMFEVPEGEVTPDQRRIAKTLNFAIIYGVSDFGLAENLKIPRKTAADYMERYSRRYPAVTAFMEETVRVARERGYVETLFGRRRYIPDLNARNPTLRWRAERQAINAPIQGTAADIIKRAMVALAPKLAEGGFKSELILQVHDELVFEAPRDEVERLCPLVRATMEEAFTMDVPLVVEVKVGPNWEEAH